MLINDKIYYWLLGYLIGLIKSKEIITKVESLILQDVWIDEFIDLSTSNFYTRNDLEKASIFSYLNDLVEDKWKSFELNMFGFLNEKLKNNRESWPLIQEVLYKYLVLKKNLLQLTSNDISNHWWTLSDDYCLRKDGYSGILNMPSDLSIFLNDYSQKGSADSFIDYIDDAIVGSN